jgi:hypothetical protein
MAMCEDRSDAAHLTARALPPEREIAHNATFWTGRTSGTSTCFSARTSPANRAGPLELRVHPALTAGVQSARSRQPPRGHLRVQRFLAELDLDGICGRRLLRGCVHGRERRRIRRGDRPGWLVRWTEHTQTRARRQGQRYRPGDDHARRSTGGGRDRARNALAGKQAESGI